VDLQKEVHEDMEQNLSAYPHQRRWLSWRPDPNIDHRSVSKLTVFFSRQRETLPIPMRAEDYLPGDIVAWDLGGGVLHIGIVVGEKSAEGGRRLIVHNIGQGPKREDVLFQWKIMGHNPYFGPPRAASSDSLHDTDSIFAVQNRSELLTVRGAPPSIRDGPESILAILPSESQHHGQGPALQRSGSGLQV
jgi:hypothetical protein